MRAVRFEHYGGIEVLQVVDVERPEPGQGQLLVRVRAAGINPGESKIREGLLETLFPATFPSGEGSDLAGVVEQVGAGVGGFAPGDEVIGFTNGRSSHAEFVLVAAEHAMHRPESVPWEVGGSIYVAGATAWAMVDAVGVGAGDTVLVAGATGGVGTIAVQLARLRGATVIGVAGGHYADWLQEHGVTAVRYGDDVEARIVEAAPGGRVDALLDCFGGGYVELALGMGVPPGRINTIVDFEAAGRHEGVKTAGNAQGASIEVVRELIELVAAGRLDVPIAQTFALEDVQAAYTALEQGRPLGKIVLIP